MFILPEARPSLASQLGSGLGSGLSKSAELAAQLSADRRKQKNIAQLLSGNSGAQESNSSNEPRGSDPFSNAKAAAVQSGDYGIAARILSDEAKQKSKESFAREKMGEPRLLEMGEKLRHLEESGMRFERLNELFSPELEEKFPSNISVALATKNGELRPLAQSILSPEAQESVKLISDELSGAKDTFGARVTNFDLQSYMKRLPTLLNSAEGRRRVLRDLRMMNSINQEYHKGVLDVVDRYGGPGKISISKAENIFKKEFAPKMKDLREEFVNPDKKNFSHMPEASMYSGRRIVDEETGQVFKSDGKEWVRE